MAEMFLTVAQTAERLQLHPITVRRQIARGEIRAIRKGRAVRVPESALRENSPTVSTPQGAAQMILDGLQSGDKATRNAAILRLTKADAPTRSLVEQVVAAHLESYDGPEDDWSAGE